MLNRLHWDAPRIAMQGNLALAAGIARGGDSLARGLEIMFERQQQQKERVKQEGDLTTALRKTLSIAYPDRKDEFNALGLPDLQGVLEGEALKSAENKRRESEEAAAALSRMVEGNARAELERYYENPEQFAGPPTGAMEAFKNAKAVNAPNFAKVMEAIESQQEGGAIQFSEDPETGARFALRGKGMMPSGVNPKKRNTITVTDPETGEDIDLPVDKNGRVIWKPNRPRTIAREFRETLGNLEYGLSENPGPREKPADVPGRIEATRKQIKRAIDNEHAVRGIDDRQRDALYQQYGFGGASGTSPRGGSSANSPANYDDELQKAQAAIAKGRDRKAVAALFKQRTGRELP